MPNHHPTIAQTYRTAMHHRSLVLGGLVGVLVLSVLVDCAVGPAALSPTTLLRAMFAPAGVDEQTSLIVWQIRLPYALMAACVGAALGLAGAEMQTILANPLASPFTLGLSAAGAFGASLAIVLGWHINPVPDMWLTAGSAFVCSALSVWILDTLVRLRQGGTGTVILCGVALVFSFQALVALMQFVANEDALQNLVFWTLGSLTRATWSTLGLLGGALACIFPFSLRAAWPLTTLRMGEDRAASLGVDVPRLRRASLLRISLLCALAVAFVGVIGFIGLVAPHIARRLVGEDHRFYLPASMLSGAFILSLAALVARVLVPGVVVPTGIVTALVGIPFFLVIVLRRGEGTP
ncbi:iron chelate uptake ABC transporter family permease subunit [Acetobacter lambici]|uniref:Iron ABC transporter permease n=1 Tax=Acetobacter lambici TaxID=1332824 RepID=A0ABT1F424_9PROT|nr:iron ABC transporter permease [Acetobacter lambici]MCP1243193.1 iron ABC transporter permease [Acetobacter lambici]MCP1258479.1 iron ABC transporter permease [Acetobacter lambici]NHO57183.1 iron chelate uptake ABC transporter family permease subunit [Acetobacter lambici]